MKTTWVVVADEAIARILRWSGKKLEPVEELTDPAAHASGSELRRDAYGRRSGSPAPQQERGQGNATASAGQSAQHLEAEEFARRVAERLAQGLQQKGYDELRIVAAPRFLGLLRKALGNEVAATVTDEVDKDLVHMDNADIAQRLFPPRTVG